MSYDYEQMQNGEAIAGQILESANDVTICELPIPENTTARIDAVCILQRTTAATNTSYKLSANVIRETGNVSIIGSILKYEEEGATEGYGVTLTVSSNLLKAVTENSDGYTYEVSCYINYYSIKQWVSRVLPDSNDVLVYQFDESASPYVNTGTAGTSANLTKVGTLYHQQTDQWGTNKSLGLGTNDASRYYASGANAVTPAYPITVSFWFYWIKYAGVPYNQHIFDKQHTTGVWSGGVYTSIQFQNNRYNSRPENIIVSLRGVTGAYIELSGSNSIPLNEWVHVGLTYDGAEFIIYKNGEQVYSGAASGNIDYGNGPWFVGAIPSGSGLPEPTYGRISDARVATTIRSPSWFKHVYSTKVF